MSDGQIHIPWARPWQWWDRVLRNADADRAALVPRLQALPGVRAVRGDPAWNARMTPKLKAYGQKLTTEGNNYTLTITPQRGVESFKPVNTNGAQRGWRPIVELLDHRVSDVKIVDGGDLNPVITDDFVLVPNPRVVDLAREYRVSFTASRID